MKLTGMLMNLTKACSIPDIIHTLADLHHMRC